MKLDCSGPSSSSRRGLHAHPRALRPTRPRSPRPPRSSHRPRHPTTRPLKTHPAAEPTARHPLPPPICPALPFDVVHAHQVLLHLADPVAGLREMLRATRPAGVIAARDADYAAAAFWPADPRLDRWLEIYRAVAHDNGTEPDAGRRLMAWAHSAGADDVTPSASIWCHATPEQRAWWGGQWAERIISSTIAERAITSGRATTAELADISTAWTEWAKHPDGWFAIPHGEILCRVPPPSSRSTARKSDSGDEAFGHA